MINSKQVRQMLHLKNEISILFFLLNLLSPSLSQAQQKDAKKTKKKMRAYSFYYLNPERISDSSWIKSESIYTHKGDDIITILYQRNGDLWKVIVKDIDSLHNPRSFTVFNDKGIIVSGKKRTFDKKGNLFIQRPPMLDPAMECKMRSPYIICKCNDNGDVISYELRSESNKDYIISKEKYEYEYWEDK